MRATHSIQVLKNFIFIHFGFFLDFNQPVIEQTPMTVCTYESIPS